MGKFDLGAACPGKAKRQKTIPKARDVVIGPSWSAPPSAVASKLGPGSDWLMGVDIETNDWEKVSGIKGTFGQFGHYSLCTPVDLQARIVQLGARFVKTFLIRWSWHAQPEMKRIIFEAS